MKSKAAPGGSRDVAQQPIRIVVVDDHVFMRELICTTLARQRAFYDVVAQAGSAGEAIAACEKLSPNLVILDINLPGRSGIEVLPELRRVAPGAHILLCTAFASEDRIIDSIRSGADGFVEKTNTWKDFLDAVDRVSRGERFFRSTCPASDPGSVEAGSDGRTTPKAHLSPREREVLTLIAHGSTSKEIAAELFISVQTVETHRSNLMSKLHVRNVAGLVLFAVHNGLIQLPVDGNRHARS